MFPWFSRVWFNYIHNNFLIYNTCWEDPAIDRYLLNLNQNSDVLMITSAGSNALDYLLDSPHSIDSVDVNYRQNALLDLKLALIKTGSPDGLKELFMNGKSVRYLDIYRNIRKDLSVKSRPFWDKNISYFSEKGHGFYYKGSSGIFANLLTYILKRKNILLQALELFETDEADEREKLYHEIEKKLWSGIAKYIWKWNGILSLAGIPKGQRDAIGDLNTFIKKTLRQIFILQNPKENYFWKVYISGSYSPECCPNYLKEHYFRTLNSSINRLRFYNSDITRHLQHTDAIYSHFVLLDHMDWLANYNNPALAREWEAILKHAKPKAKILFRTAYGNLDFLPDFIFKLVNFEKIDPEWINHNDRVSTYTGTYIGTVL